MQREMNLHFQTVAEAKNKIKKFERNETKKKRSDKDC
jgi:hypothetical protein